MNINADNEYNLSNDNTIKIRADIKLRGANSIAPAKIFTLRPVYSVIKFLFKAFAISAAAVILLICSAANCFAQTAPGPGNASISPSRVLTGALTNISFGISYDGPDSIYEVQISIPHSWRFTPDFENVVIEGAGMQLASVYKIEGAGYQNKEYVVRVAGCSITSGKTGQISLVNLGAPMFIASSQSSLNKFNIKTRIINTAAADIASSPVCETYNPNAYSPSLLINEAASKIGASGDFIEIYCRDDGNFGNGVDLNGWQIADLAQTTSDKTFGPLIIKTGNYLSLKYNSNQADDIFPSLNSLNTYSAKTGINDDGFMMVIKNPSDQITDALVCAASTYDLNYNNMAYLNSKKQWQGMDRKSAVDIDSLQAGYSVARIPDLADSNNKSDFSLMNYQTPLKYNGNLGINAKILINEFKAASTNNDFIELYVADDGSGGGGTDLAGYEISDGINFKYICPQDSIARTNDYIVINFNSSSSGVVSKNSNTINISSTATGISKVFGALTVKNSALKILDAVCYSSGPIVNESHRLLLKELVSGGHIIDMAPPLLYDDNDCVSIKNLALNSSFGRNDKSVDTNSQTDFINFINPTPGKPNIAAGLPIALTCDQSGDIIYAAADSELKINLRAVDVNGETALVSSNIISVTSDSQGTMFSEDGINYYSKLEPTLRYGQKRIFIKDSVPGTKIITFREKFDERLTYKLKFVVSGAYPVQINEIMYYPPPDIVKNPSDLQWVELHNNSSSRKDISGHKIKCGRLTYTFAQNTIIEGYSFIVVTSRLLKSSYREEASFADIYGNKDGEWTAKDGFTALDAGDFRISSSGGRIAFTTADDIEVSVLEYNSSSGGKADGMTLEKAVQTVYSIGDSEVDRYNFYKSSKQYGTPGQTNSKNQNSSSSLSLEHIAVSEAVVNQPLMIYAKVSGADIIEVGYRNSAVGGIYTFIPMKKIDNTSVYRTIIPGISVSLSGLDYYIRVLDFNKEAAYSPSGGPDSPHKVKVIDNAPKIRLTTPVQSVAPAESFFVDVYLENAPGISNLSFDLFYNASYLTVEDLDLVRPGIQIASGSLFGAHYCEINEVNSSEGKISFKLIDETASAGPAGQAARIKFKSVSNYGAVYPEFVNLTFKNVVVSSSADVNVFDDKIKIGDKASAVVGIKGGTVGGENQAKLIIPAGAVKTDTAFSIKKLIKSEIPPTNIIDNMNGIHSLEVAYEFQPYGFKFQKPVVVEIPYTAAELAAGGLDDSKNIKIYFYNTAHLAYERIGGTLSSNKISAKVNDLALYMLVNDQSKSEFDLKDIFVSPNPFSPNGNGWNDSTFINYTTTVDSNITIKIFDVRGVLIRRLLNGETVSGGRNKAEWDGRDDFGRIVKTGVYVYQLKSLSAAKSSKTYQGTIVVSKNLRD